MNIALFGYGYWGPNLARNIHALATLYAVCDSDQGRLSTARRLYPLADATAYPPNILDCPEVAAVVIATPACTHFQLAKAAILAGKHVLVEKPLALISTDAMELIQLSRTHGKILMVGHTFEYNPAVLKVKELLGAIGDIYYTHSTRVNLGRVQRDISALWSIAPHDISILIYLFGMPVEVSARGACYLGGVEDVVYVSLAFAGGVTAHIHASWLDPDKVRRMTIVGSSGMIVYDDVAGEVRVYDKRADGGSGDVHIPAINKAEPLRNEVAHFIECIERNQIPRTDGENGLRVVEALEAAQFSMDRRGVPVAIA